MSKHLRISAFLAAMSCFVLAAGFYYLGFELSPLSFTFADGATTPYPTEQVTFVSANASWGGSETATEKPIGNSANNSLCNMERWAASSFDSGALPAQA
jgi:hypothetical protein